MTELVPANDATLATIDQKIHYSQTISASNLLPEAYRGKIGRASCRERV